MTAPVPSYHGSYRDITAALSERIATARETSGFREWLASPVEIVIPSRGVAEAIVAALLERTPGGVTGIQLRTLDSLAREILNRSGEFPRVASDEEHRLAMQTVTASIDDPLMENRGIAALLLRSYRDIRDSGVSIAHFRSHTRSLRNSARSAVLGEAFARYEQKIAALQAVDPADVIERASAIDPPKISAQILFGFYDATGVQRRLIESLIRNGKLDSVYVPVPLDGGSSYRFGESFQIANTQRSAASIAGWQAAQPSMSIHRETTRHRELRETAREIATLLREGVPPRDIGIVVRSMDDHNARLLERYASEFGFAVTPRVAVPLRSHAIGRAISIVLNLRERDFPRSDVLEIVRTGWNVRVDNGNPNDLDAATRINQIAGGGSASVATVLERSTKRVEELKAYKAIVETLEKLTEPLTRSMKGREWSDYLDRLVALFRVETESDLDAIEALDRLARTLAKPSFAETIFFPSSIVRAIENADDLPQRGSAELPLIWFGDVMKLRGRTFAHLFALSIEQGRFPQDRTEDALVPNFDRRRLGIREIVDGTAEEEFLFEILLGSARESIALSFATRDASGKEARASYFLKNLAQRLDPARQREVVRDFESYAAATVRRRGIESRLEASASAMIDGRAQIDEGVARRLRMMANLGNRSPYDGYLSSNEPLINAIRERIVEISPTDLEHYGECPQRFFVRKLLGVRELEEPEHEVQIDRRKKGSLDHTILERFYSQLAVEEIDGAFEGRKLAPHLAERLRSAIDEEFARHNLEYPPVNPAIREIEKEYTRSILEEFIATDLADLARSGFVPRHFEYEFGMTGENAPAFTFAPAGVTIRVRGKIDRIDVKGDPIEKLRVIDYKSGRAIRQQGIGRNIDAGHSFQLPLYAIAYGALSKLADSAIQGLIRPIRIHGLKESDYSFELAEKRELLDKALELFVGAIARGEFPAFPDEHCEYCAVAASCRTKHAVEERQALKAFGNAMTLLREGSGLGARRPGGETTTGDASPESRAPSRGDHQ